MSNEEGADMPLMKVVFFINMSELVGCFSTSINHFATTKLDVSIAKFTWFRSSVMFCIALSVLTAQGNGYTKGLTRENLPYYIARQLCSTVFYYTFTAVFKYLPLLIGSTLIRTSSLITPFMA